MTSQKVYQLHSINGSLCSYSSIEIIITNSNIEVIEKGFCQNAMKLKVFSNILIKIVGKSDHSK